MATLTAIREGIAHNLEAIADVQVSAYMLASPTPPTLQVVPGETLYDGAMGRGHDTWTLTVQAFVGFAADIGAQKRMDKMLASSGADSVKAAVQSDRTLGGAAQDLRVTRASGYQTFVFEGRPPLLGAEWIVEVIATG